MARIRLLEPGDFHRGFLETMVGLAPVDLTPEEADKVLQERTISGITTLVAEQEGMVVGTASLLIERKFIHRGGTIGHIEDVAVHPDFGGRGIGQELVAQLIELASRARCYKVILNCHEHLIPFYERSGFRRHDTGMRIDLADQLPPR